MDMKELQRGLVESSLNLGMLHSGIIIVGQKIGGGLVRCMQVEVKVHKPEDGEDVPEKPSVSVLLHPYVIPPYLIEEDASTFLRSLFALRSYVPRIAALGQAGAPFAALERCGMEAEAGSKIVSGRRPSSPARVLMRSSTPWA